MFKDWEGCSIFCGENTVGGRICQQKRKQDHGQPMGVLSMEQAVANMVDSLTVYRTVVTRCSFHLVER